MRLIGWRLGVLELALLLLFGSLILQLLVPVLVSSEYLRESWERILAALDVRRWSRFAWLVSNLLFVASLVFIRFVPNLRGWKMSRSSPAETRDAQATVDVRQNLDERRRRDEEWRKRAKRRRPYY
jgi:hypothetical protein